jgi:Tol biopolymer transport system component/DNA-binding winged helix-turn-helix (wHTH) protein
MALPHAKSPPLRFGPYELDIAAGRLLKNGIAVKLQPQPFRVLLLLIQHAGEVVPREEIQSSVWGDSTFVDFERGINFCINQIRAVLCDNAEKPRYIETIPRCGYRFIGQLTASLPLNSAAKAEPASPKTVYDWPTDSKRDAEPLQLLVSPKATVRALSFGAKALVLALVLITALAGFGFYVWKSRKPQVSNEELRIRKLSASGNAQVVALSPDGRFAVLALGDDANFGLWLHQVSTGSDIQVLATQKGVAVGITISPDNNYIYLVRTFGAFAGHPSLFVMPLVAGNVRKLLDNVNTAVSFSPDGRQFAFTRIVTDEGATEIRVADADGTHERLLTKVFNTFPAFQGGTAWSPDGRTIAFSLHAKEGFVLQTVSVADGSVREVLKRARAIGRPQWMPEGNALLVELDDDSQRGQLWLVDYPQGQLRRVTNDLGSYDLLISATRDGKAVAAVQWLIGSHVWVLPNGDDSKARELTTGELAVMKMDIAPDGQMLLVSKDAEMWLLNADGSGLARFTTINNAEDAIFCGDFVISTTYRSGSSEIMRINRDGTNVVQLATGHLVEPVCSWPGKDIFAVDVSSWPKIVRIPVAGGAPVEVAKTVSGKTWGHLSISPDGKLIAYSCHTDAPDEARRITVISSSGGSPVVTLALAEDSTAFHWSPSRKAIQYLQVKDGTTNVWEVPFSGGNPKQLTHFTSGEVYDYGWSPDGKDLFLARGEFGGDPVLLTQIQ